MSVELRRATQNLRRKGQFVRGLLGDFSGTIAVAARPGYYYVRVEKPGGYEVGIFSGRVRALYNLPVRIETHPLTNQQFIAGVDDEMIAYSGENPATIPAIELHGVTHGWGGDDMVMWLHTIQLFPLRCQPHPTNSAYVVIQAGTYFTAGRFCVLAEPLAVDLSAYFPASARRWVLVYMQSDLTADVQDDGALNLAELVPVTGKYLCAAVRLRAGAGVGWEDIVDARFIPQESGSGEEILAWISW